MFKVCKGCCSAFEEFYMSTVYYEKHRKWFDYSKKWCYSSKEDVHKITWRQYCLGICCDGYENSTLLCSIDTILNCWQKGTIICGILRLPMVVVLLSQKLLCIHAHRSSPSNLGFPDRYICFCDTTFCQYHFLHLRLGEVTTTTLTTLRAFAFHSM